MRRVVEVADTAEDARKMRETFVARGARRERELPVGWPHKVKIVGRCLAVMYSSDKWHDVGEFEDYKHVAEAPQELAVSSSFGVRGYSDKKSLRMVGPEVGFEEPMPKHMAELAPLLGIQVQLYESVRKDKGILGNGDQHLLEIEIPKAVLGGARHPVTRQPFLVIYVQGASGVLGVVTGAELDVLADGIVG